MPRNRVAPLGDAGRSKSKKQLAKEADLLAALRPPKHNAFPKLLNTTPTQQSHTAHDDEDLGPQPRRSTSDGAVLDHGNGNGNGSSHAAQAAAAVQASRATTPGPILTSRRDNGGGSNLGTEDDITAVFRAAAGHDAQGPSPGHVLSRPSTPGSVGRLTTPAAATIQQQPMRAMGAGHAQHQGMPPPLQGAGAGVGSHRVLVPPLQHNPYAAAYNHQHAKQSQVQAAIGTGHNGGGMLPNPGYMTPTPTPTTPHFYGTPPTTPGFRPDSPYVNTQQQPAYASAYSSAGGAGPGAGAGVGAGAGSGVSPFQLVHTMQHAASFGARQAAHQPPPFLHAASMYAKPPHAMPSSAIKLVSRRGLKTITPKPKREIVNGPDDFGHGPAYELSTDESSDEEDEDGEDGDEIDEEAEARSSDGSDVERDDNYLRPDLYLRQKFRIPSIEEAERHRAHTTFRRGDAPYCSTTANDFLSLGVGVALYFKILKTLGIGMLIMALCLIPTVVMSAAGTRITDDYVDLMRLSLSTIGNMGGCPTNATDVSEEALFNCSVAAEPVDAFGTQFTPIQAAYLVSLADFASSVVFMLMGFILWRQINSTVKHYEHKKVNMSRYAVYVSGLPKTATKREILKHMNRLYRLDEPVSHSRAQCGRFCCCRTEATREVPSYGPKPVHDYGNTEMPMYYNTWVAEVQMVTPNGDSIRHYLKLYDLVQRLRNARARVLQVSENTPLKNKKGESLANEKKREKALRKVEKLQARMDKVKAALKRHADKHPEIENECIGAFVVFEHRESKRRCLEDYSQSRGWWGLGTVCQPINLWFRKRHPLYIETAMPPSNIIFENLDTSSLSKCIRRTLTTLLTVALLAGTFAVILMAKQNRATFSARPLSECKTDVAAGSFGTYIPRPLVPDLYRNQSLDANCMESAEQSCAPASERCPSDHYYVYYTGDVARAKEERGIYTQLQANDTCGGPCVPSSDAPQANDRCPVLACLQPAWKELGFKCSSEGSYPAATRIGCYCWQLLVAKVKDKGIISGSIEALDEDNGGMCSTFTNTYFTGQLMTIAVALTIVLVNALLNFTLQKVVAFERHTSKSKEQHALASKLVISQFLNTAVISLLIYTKLPEGIDFPLLKQFSILNGNYGDVGSEWYAAVGVAILVTMLFNTVGPHLAPTFLNFVLFPLKRKLLQRMAVTQQRLDDLYEGSNWKMAVRHAYVMNTMCVAMFYSSGMPVLLLLAAGGIGFTYTIDKFLLMRKFHKPPAYDTALADAALQTLPIALLLHTGMCVATFGNGEILTSEMIAPSLLSGTAGDAESVADAYDQFVEATSAYDKFGWIPRVLRINVFPHFLIFFLLGVGLLIRATIGSILLKMLCPNRTGRSTAASLTTGSKADEARGNVPFTRVFREVLADFDSQHKWLRKVPPPLSKFERKHGWVIRQEGNQYILMKQWMHTGSTYGHHHRRGVWKKTWEVIADDTAHSYQLENISRYRKLRLVKVDLKDYAEVKPSAKWRIGAKLAGSWQLKSLFGSSKSKFGSPMAKRAARADDRDGMESKADSKAAAAAMSWGSKLPKHAAAGKESPAARTLKSVPSLSAVKPNRVRLQPLSK